MLPWGSIGEENRPIWWISRVDILHLVANLFNSKAFLLTTTTITSHCYCYLPLLSPPTRLRLSYRRSYRRSYHAVADTPPPSMARKKALTDKLGLGLTPKD